MDRRERQANQDACLGALLGMAIGDALGMPVAGWPAERIHAEYGRVERYFPLTLPDGAEVKPGEFTDESEAALCIVESLTVNGGALDPENIGPRLMFLARGEAKRWMVPETIALLERAAETMHYQVPLDEDGPATGDVVARGIPIGLMHAVGAFRPDALRQDAEVVTRLTHGSPLAIAATTAAAHLVQLAARKSVPPDRWATETAEFIAAGEVAERLRRAAEIQRGDLATEEAIRALGTGLGAAEVIASAYLAAARADAFEDAVFAAVNAGGATDSRGALAGAIAGAYHGASGIPQRLIDDLEGRIYVSLAAPWFYRTAQRSAGSYIELREIS